jgi:hypothetical protein
MHANNSPYVLLYDPMTFADPSPIWGVCCYSYTLPVAYDKGEAFKLNEGA